MNIDSSQLTDKLIILIEPTFRLLVYTQKLGYTYESLLTLAKRFKVSINQLFTTTCGIITYTLKYLLTFKKQSIDITKFESQYAYIIDIIGSTNDLSHIMILLYTDKWIIIDAYIGCRKFGYREVNSIELYQLLQDIQLHWNEKLWIQLTGCAENEPPNQSVKVIITAHTYDLTNIHTKYNLLYTYAEKKFSEERSRLQVLHTDINLMEADQYIKHIDLNSLINQ